MATAFLQATFNAGEAWVWNTGLLTAWIDFEAAEIFCPTYNVSGINPSGVPIPYQQVPQIALDRAGVGKWICGGNFWSIASGAFYTNITASIAPYAKFGNWMGICNGPSGLWYSQTLSPYLFPDQVAGEQQNPIGLFSNRPFTLDMFVYVTAYNIGGNQYNLIGSDDPLGQRGLEMFINTTGYLCAQFYTSTGVAYPITGSTQVPLNQWSHVAFCRVGDTLSLYLNGTLVGTTALAAGAIHNDGQQWTGNGSALYAPTSAIEIGGCINGRSGYSSQCYFDDIVITTGCSMYNGNFTPRTSPFNPLVEGAWGQLMPSPIFAIQPMLIVGSVGLFPNSTLVSYQLTVTGGTGTYSNLQVVAGSLPAGITATLTSNIVTVSGVATAAVGTAYSFTLQVQDALGNPGSFSNSGNIVNTTSTWDPGTMNPYGVLSSPNVFTNSNSGLWGAVRSTTFKNIATANHYFELILAGTPSGDAFIGIGQAGANSVYPGNDSQSYGFDTSGNVYFAGSVFKASYGPAFNSGTLGCLIKNGALYFRNSSGWMNGADPISAQTGWVVNGLTGNWYASGALYYSGTSEQLVTNSSSMTLWTPTSGSQAWDGY